MEWNNIAKNENVYSYSISNIVGYRTSFNSLIKTRQILLRQGKTNLVVNSYVVDVNQT